MNIQKIDSVNAVFGETFTREVTPSPKTPMANNVDPAKQSDTLPNISQAAINLHRIDQSLHYMETAVSKSKSQLAEMRRTLPPFQPEDAERVRILRGYIGLRQMIDELTFPPPAKSEWIKDGINLPPLSEKSSDQEVDGAISSLDNAAQTLHQKRASLGTGVGI